MTYLIDTNIVIGYLRGRERVVSKVNELLGLGLAVSTVSIAELYHGASKSQHPSGSMAKVESFIGIPEVRVLNLDLGVAKEYGRLMNELEAGGLKMAGLDVLIAATAEFHGLIILTEDRKHFARLRDFDVKIEFV